MTSVEHPCPQCGELPTPESNAEQALSDLGYLHEDRRLECENGHEWTIGIPRGSTDDDTWVCDACGGDLMPHFVYVFDDHAKIKPKCQDCYWVPDDPIRLDASSNETSTRLFVGHHTVTGSREEAISNDYK